MFHLHRKRAGNCHAPRPGRRVRDRKSVKSGCQFLCIETVLRADGFWDLTHRSDSKYSTIDIITLGILPYYRQVGRSRRQGHSPSQGFIMELA